MKWDWELTKDWKLLEAFSKLGQAELPPMASSDNVNLASRLAIILKQQMDTTAKPTPPLSEKTDPSKEEKNQSPTNTPVAQSKKLQGSQLVSKIAQLSPFNSNYLDFGEIKQFIDLYAQLDDTANSMTARVNQDIADAQKLMTAPSDNISLDNINTTTFAMITNQPVPLATILYDIALNASNLYRKFAVHYKNELQGDQDSGAYRRVIQQAQPEGPAASNLRTLTQLLTQVRSQVGKHR
jgi:hypothetical protein